MDVIDKINFLLKERRLSKRDFAQRLIALQPKLKRTGEIPTESTIYGYLSGARELKIELIPYVAEVLNVKEQELFEFDVEYASDHNIERSKEVREIIALLRYVPSAKIKEFKARLEEYKSLFDKNY